MEKKVDFVYSPFEATRQYFLTSGYFVPMPVDKFYGQVTGMIQSGWNDKKILNRCKRLNWRNRGQLSVPLVQIVYYRYPDLGSIDNDELRTALLESVQLQIAREKASLFRYRTEGHLYDENDALMINVTQEIRNLIKFAANLTQEVSPSHGIRNK